VAKPEGKGPLGRPMRRWEDNTKVHLLDMGCGVMDWIELARVRDRWRTLENAVMKLRVPTNVENFLTTRETVSFSRRTLLHGVIQ
jgi:hypothetical protein